MLSLIKKQIHDQIDDIAKKLNCSHDHSKEGSVAIIIISIYYRNITIISIGGFIA
jgi:hypothetical protein